MNRVRAGYIAVLLAAACFSVSCTMFAAREPSAIEAPSFVTPTAQELFLTGKFSVKKNPLKFLDEDHYGQELDLSERRPAVELRGTIFEKKYGKDGTRLVGNFYHKGEFWIARLPQTDRLVKNVYFILSYFPPKIGNRYLAAHSLLRFQLEHPIELVAKMPTLDELNKMARATPDEEIKMLSEPYSGEDYLIPDIAISAEAQWVKNDKYKTYSLKRGGLGAFIQIVRFESMNVRFEELYQSGNPSAEFLFKMKDASSGDKILNEALRSSESDALSKLYDTFWYNCTTMAFDIVERGEGVKDERLGFIRSFMQKRIPPISAGKIEEYGGVEATPLAVDPTLFDQSEDAYQDKIAIPRREICPEGFTEENCTIVNSAVDALKKAGRI